MVPISTSEAAFQALDSLKKQEKRIQQAAAAVLGSKGKQAPPFATEIGISAKLKNLQQGEASIQTAIHSIQNEVLLPLLPPESSKASSPPKLNNQ